MLFYTKLLLYHYFTILVGGHYVTIVKLYILSHNYDTYTYKL